MSRPTTNRDIQRIAFVESLHKSLKQQAAKDIAEHKKFLALANSYVSDGLEESESVELLMIDGLPRETAESYVAMAANKAEDKTDGLIEYSFQFEDAYNKIWSSFDIGKTIRAANDDDAWEKAEEALNDSFNIDLQKIISVDRIS